MENTVRINGEVTVGPQPTDEELTELRKQGFQTIANFRNEGEEDQPLSPDVEGQKARTLGMAYLNVPVSIENLTPQTVDHFREQYAMVPKPVFAHCRLGKRAAAMLMMHIGCEQGRSGEQTLQKAKELGFDFDKPELRDFITTYVDDHSKG
jgi:uncharacterized protein (TIGR01244 family)